MDNWKLWLAGAIAAPVGSAFALAIKSPGKFVTLLKAVLPAFPHMFSISFGMFIGSLLGPGGWAWSGFAATFFLFFVARSGLFVAEHLIRAEIAEGHTKQGGERDEEPEPQD